MGTYSRIVATVVAVVTAAAPIGSCSSSKSTTAHDGSKSTTTTAADLTLGVTGDTPAATLDPRYSSYNLEMVTVTGGSFWAPYGADAAKADRPPIDLTSQRLRNLTKALGPAYIRVSGSWANSAYFDPTGTPGEPAPPGFNSVLTGEQWNGVGAFATAVDARIVTSYPSSPGAFDAEGRWKPDEAVKRMRYDTANHIPVVAVELFNEANLPVAMPAGYDAADFARDFNTLATVAGAEMPALKLVAPSATNDVDPLVVPASIRAEDMVKATGSKLNVFSYHFYPKTSQRCGGTGSPATGLEASYLDHIDAPRDFYTGLRDTYAPGAPMWVTETAQASCGGDPWASDFVDVIRFVDTLGRLSNGDGTAVFHNTLVGSDYAFLSEDGFAPRPTYWAAVLWHRLMGPKVLTPRSTDTTGEVTTYAQCTPGRSKGATYAAINTSATATHRVAAPSPKTTTYQLTGRALDAPTVMLNGTELHAAADGTPPRLDGASGPRVIELPPASVTFVADPTAVKACA